MKTYLSFALPHQHPMGFLFAAMLVFTLSSCDKSRRIDGSGNVVTETRTVASFDRIHTDGEMRVYLHDADEYKVVVTTDDNIMAFVDTYVDGNELQVRLSDEHLSYDATQMNVHIYSDQFNAVELNGDSYIRTMDTLTTDLFLLDINGNCDGIVHYAGPHFKILSNGRCDLEAHGTADQADFRINGSGKIDALDLYAFDANADINGSGRIYVYATETLEASVDGSGHIYYSGSPAVNATVNGTGSVEAY